MKKIALCISLYCFAVCTHSLDIQYNIKEFLDGQKETYDFLIGNCAQRCDEFEEKIRNGSASRKDAEDLVTFIYKINSALCEDVQIGQDAQPRSFRSTLRGGFYFPAFEKKDEIRLMLEQQKSDILHVVRRFSTLNNSMKKPS